MAALMQEASIMEVHIIYYSMMDPSQSLARLRYFKCQESDKLYMSSLTSAICGKEKNCCGAHFSGR